MKRNFGIKESFKEEIITKVGKLSLSERRKNEIDKYIKIYTSPSKEFMRSKDNRHYGSGFHAEPMLDLIKTLDIKSICDVGTGNGEFPEWMVLNGCKKVYATDLTRTKAAEKNGVVFIECTARFIPLGSKIVEWVSAFDVLEHLLFEDLVDSLEEMKRIATKGFLFSIPGNESFTKINGKKVRLHQIVKPIFFWQEVLSDYGVVTVLSGKGSTNYYQVDFKD